MKPTITALEHYERLARAGHGRNDSPLLQEFMARWDGPLLFQALGDLRGKDVLEVGIGCGRVSRQVLTVGCRSLTGLDISSTTIRNTEEDLAEFPNVELVLADIEDFVKPDGFDAAYSVLTFMHVQNKQLALQNVVHSLREGGHLVLSIDNPTDLIDFGTWKVDLHPWLPEQYAEALSDAGCEVDPLVPLIDTMTGPDGKKSDTYGEVTATLVKARKVKKPYR